MRPRTPTAPATSCIFNTGEEIVHSKNGLLTTVGYKLGDAAPHYALEGSIAVTGSLVQWLRDNLGMIIIAQRESRRSPRTVDDNGGVYFVPAFSGLFAPYWRSDARGAIVGLTRFVNKGHIARAALEATAFQTREVLDAVNADSGVPLTELKVDGGMVRQQPADAVPGRHPRRSGGPAQRRRDHGARRRLRRRSGRRLLERTSASCSANWPRTSAGSRTMDEAERERQMRHWKKAVTKTLDWVDDDVK